jgi:hypothetical protein
MNKFWRDLERDYIARCGTSNITLDQVDRYVHSLDSLCDYTPKKKMTCIKTLFMYLTKGEHEFLWEVDSAGKIGSVHCPPGSLCPQCRSVESNPIAPNYIQWCLNFYKRYPSATYRHEDSDDDYYSEDY